MAMKAIFVCVLLTCLVASAFGDGRKSFGEECSVIGQIANVFTGDKGDDPNACMTDRGLVCAVNKCACVPPKNWNNGYLGVGFLGGGECVSGAPALNLVNSLYLMAFILSYYFFTQ